MADLKQLQPEREMTSPPKSSANTDGKPAQDAGKNPDAVGPSAPLAELDAFVVIATLGRSEALGPLLQSLSAQTLPPKGVVIIGVHPSDTAGIDEADYRHIGLKLIHAGPPGSSSQRNLGVNHVAALVRAEGEAGGQGARRYAVYFFDDDYRPARTWIEKATARLKKNDIAGITGLVLRDGVITGAVTEAEAILASQTGYDETEIDVGSGYGCNMVLMDHGVESIPFDENLPLYGWLEDRLLTKKISARFGPIIQYRACVGVHLANAKSGRSKGNRIGHSQIANPIYLHGQRAMGNGEMLYYVGRALASNLLRTAWGDQRYDYRGRMKGNMKALGDLFAGRMSPRRILEL